MSEPRSPARRANVYLAFVVAVCLLAGCGPALSEDSTSGRIDIDPAAVAGSDEQLSVVDRAGLDDLIESHRGRVMLVDFWATWCGPCVEQLPHTIDLARRHSDRGLTVVTVSLDDPSEATRISEFLRSQGAAVATNFVSQFGASPQSIEVFDISGGAVPHYKLYDRSGQLRHSYGVDPSAAKQYTQQEIDAAIEQLLSE